jgi:nitrogen fixation protein NifZ
VIPAFDIGDLVLATKALRNDGTYPEPGIATGAVLVPAGTRGEVLNVGLYLQEHIVYAVAFGNGRVVGCLGRELEAVTTTATPAAAGNEKGEQP